MSEAVCQFSLQYYKLRVLIRVIQLIDRLVADIIEITEGVSKQDSSFHTLAELGSQSKARVHEAKLHPGEGSQSSGTYAKQC